MNIPYKVKIGMGIENTPESSGKGRRKNGKNKNLEDCT